jgi:predicted DNA binding CopG/RHH family protein
MAGTRWDPGKSQKLREERGFGFEELLQMRALAIVSHPTRSGQGFILVGVEDYVGRKDILMKKRIDPSKIKLTREEKRMEADFIKNGVVHLPGSAEFERIATAIGLRRKDAVLNIRVNSQDLENIKKKAKRLGVRYQTLISELIRQFAQ